MDFLSQLNDEQRKAAAYIDGPLLVLAGAGSGKTRVLTHRIAHLIRSHGVHPGEIFAVTFTNKAAAEMRSRIVQLLGRGFLHDMPERELWVSTFHSACVRILRSDIQHLGYTPQFTIYDDGDQRSVLKAILKELNISDTMLSPKAVQGRINRLKNDGQEADTYQSTYGGPVEDAFTRVFVRYGEVLKASSALDFGDLILLTVRLFQEHPRVLEAYQSRFTHVLIDEYQDTNRCQYLLMKLLAGSEANICAVGDEDQSIYRWRGADISNILNFEKDYPNAKIFKLEQNYRSTRNIIEAASRVISHNTERREKELWTQNTEGEKIQLIEAYDEHDEALKIVNEVNGALSQNTSLNQIAVFYRTNAQSRLLEDMLRSKGLNYQIYGGLKFYEKLEVKDALAYLKLLSNPDDDVSFRRIVNVPPRGIGAVSLERLVQKSQQRSTSCYRLLNDLFDTDSGAELGRGQKNFRKFYELMQSLEKAKKDLLPSDLLNFILEESGYRRSLMDEKTTESQSRLENLAELRQSIVEYELRTGAENPNQEIHLDGFLEQVALVSDIDRFDPEAPALKMMTIHMAKGLEFDVVLIAGLEEELFPNIRSWEAEDPSDVEEERRLFYVGMTRARQRLYIFYAKNRTVFGNAQFRTLSRFLEEIPPEYLQLKKADYFSRRRPYLERPGIPPRRSSPLDDYQYDQTNPFDEDFSEASDEVEHTTDEFLAGRRVEHPIFGEGVVRKQVGADKLLVEFRGSGVKRISRKFGQLRRL